MLRTFAISKWLRQLRQGETASWTLKAICRRFVNSPHLKLSVDCSPHTPNWKLSVDCSPHSPHWKLPVDCSSHSPRLKLSVDCLTHSPNLKLSVDCSSHSPHHCPRYPFMQYICDIWSESRWQKNWGCGYFYSLYKCYVRHVILYVISCYCSRFLAYFFIWYSLYRSVHVWWLLISVFINKIYLTLFYFAHIWLHFI